MPPPLHFMPDYYPEGDTPLPGDSELRATAKFCNQLFIANGDKGPACYPEGSRPLPGDDEQRLLNKIAALLGP
jgi:hypothetical protein